MDTPDTPMDCPHEEGMEILKNLKEQIAKHGNYTEASTIAFIEQAEMCFRQDVKAKLADGMKTYEAKFIALIRECASHRNYRDLTGKQALEKAADLLEGKK